MSSGDLIRAQDYIERSIELKSALGLMKGREKSYHNLGYIYNENGDHNEALTFYKKALRSSDPISSVAIYDKMKTAYKNLGDIPKALYLSLIHI